jgi:Flp pilus assembly protein TadG
VSRQSGSRTERGVTSLLVAVLAIVLFGCLAFVSDFGFAYSNQRRIQNGSDAAALAVGRKIAATATATDTCATIVTSFNGSPTRTIASGIFAKNVGAGAALASGSAGFQVTCETVGTNDQTVVVKVAGQQNSPSFLGGIFGRTSVPVGKTARVIVGPVGTVVGLRPFAICRLTAESVQNTPGATFVVPIDNSDQGCGSSAGNWAMLDFNGGNNNSGDMQTWIGTGYDGPISNAPPVVIQGDPGFNVNSAEAEMNLMMAQSSVVLPVYSSVTGSGQGSQYTITGFLSVIPCRYKINNKSGPTTANAACAALPASPPSEYIQLVFSSYIPVGSLNLTCKLNDNTCDNGPRTAVLAD